MQLKGCQVIRPGLCPSWKLPVVQWACPGPRGRHRTKETHHSLNLFKKPSLFCFNTFVLSLNSLECSWKAVKWSDLAFVHHWNFLSSSGRVRVQGAGLEPNRIVLYTISGSRHQKIQIGWKAASVLVRPCAQSVSCFDFWKVARFNAKIFFRFLPKAVHDTECSTCNSIQKPMQLRTPGKDT